VKGNAESPRKLIPEYPFPGGRVLHAGMAVVSLLRDEVFSSYGNQLYRMMLMYQGRPHSLAKLKA
jgi:hypothetical protein